MFYRIKNWLYAHEEFGIVVGIRIFRWELGFKHTRAFKRINIELGPLAVEISYWA